MGKNPRKRKIKDPVRSTVDLRGMWQSTPTLFILTILYSLAFFQLPFQADDEMFAFSTGNYFLNNPMEIIHQSLASSRADWSINGRLIFFSHFFALIGISFTALIVKIFAVNMVAAYAIVGIFLNCLLGYATLRLFRVISKSIKLDPKFEIVFAFIFPILILANNPFSAFRIIHWNYTFQVVWSVLLVTLVLNSLKIRSVVYRFLALQLLCVFFLFGNEITQLFGLLSIILYILVRAFQTPHPDRFHRLIKSRKSTSFLSWVDMPIVWFICTFGVVSLIVRVHARSICSEPNSCYAPSTLVLGQLNFGSFGSAIADGIGRFPPFGAISWWNSESRFNNGDNWFLVGGILVGLLTLLVFYKVFKNNSISDDFKDEKSLKILMLTFLFMVILLSVIQSLLLASERKSFSFSRMGLSDTASALFHPLTTIALTLGIIFLFYQFNYKKFFLPLLAALIFSIGTLNFWVNTDVSAQLRGTNTYMIQYKLSNELLSPGILKADDDRRCNLFREKLLYSKRWLGHDQFVFNGLNTQYLGSYGVPFCSVNIDLMFENY